jgi:glutathione S-transferase
MGFYQSEHPDVPGMRGLHLFHFVLSNCSQRVRIALEEKGLEWTSHHVDIPHNEHAGADYQRINPNGVVPTLVHDGRVILESNDIIAHLDDSFPEPPLRPADAETRSRMEQRLMEAAAFQPAFKVLSHELVFLPFRKIGPDEIALFERDHNDKGLAAFLRDYAEDGPVWRARVEQANADMTKTLDGLEDALSVSSWLSGDSYGLADISWVVNINRLNGAGVDLSRWPRFQAWGRRAMERPAFDRAVVSYTP